jgi:putative methyltransferase (TIGR04325 family)
MPGQVLGSESMREFLRRRAPAKAREIFRLILRRPARDYPTWEAAAAASRQSYDSRKLARLVRDKTVIFRQAPVPSEPVADLAMIATIARIGAADRALRVIDFGGACGAHFFLARAAFPGARWDWRVIETEAMAAEGRTLEAEGLSFFTDLGQAAEGFEADLIHTAGTLQCIPNPGETLRQLVNIGARSLILGRLGMSESGAPVFTVHRHQMSLNGRGPAPAGFADETCSYPFQFPARSEIEAILAGGYRVALKAPDASGVFPVRGARLSGAAYLCELIR